METPSLQALIGKESIALIPFIDKVALQRIKVLSFEYGGLWIECEKVTQVFLSATQLHASKTPVFFVPYTQICFVMTPTDKISLSESAFGVTD
jgi:hypothetical protein